MAELPWLLERAMRTPDALALSGASADLTWRQLEAEALALESAFASQGVQPGEVVATLTGSERFARVVHGIWLRGATVLPINSRLSLPEIVFQLKDSRARWLVSGIGDLAERAQALLTQVPGLRALALDAGSAQRQAEPPPVEPNRSVAILYTSGTTGRPKGAVLSAANFRASESASRARLDSCPGDRWLACMPLFHVGGLSILSRSVLLGFTVQVQEGFAPEVVADSLERDGITHVSLVANMLARVLAVRADAKAPPGLRRVLLGGGPAPQPLLLDAQSRGYPLALTYGLTEATSQVATRSPDDRTSIGLRPLPGVEVRMEEGSEDAGEILVRGPTVMSGYCNRPDATRRALREGWLHTGDIGRVNSDGTITILDRRSDLIISGGENVYPAEIESVLMSHPGVSEVGVGSRPDDRYGSRPVAWYVPADGEAPDASELSAYCSCRLASFKVPAAFHRIDSLPRTAAGKLVRARLGDPHRSMQ